jgi:putative transposase
LKTGGIKNPHPPRYKQEPITVTYMQNGIKRIDSKTLQLTLTNALKKHMSERYDIHEDNLIIKNRIFGDMEKIKQIKLYMPEDNVIRVIVVYEIADVKKLEDNGHYLSIDLGIHNLMTCYDSEGNSFIIGRNYLSIARWHDKEIARVQSQWEQQQSKKGIKYPKPSQHVLDLYKDKRHKIKDYIHKVTRWIADYCKTNRINTVIIGDLTGIREENDKGDRINQELHALPYKIITDILEYKLGLFGISMKRVKECYSSQCSPNCCIVKKVTATPEKRINRGLYQDGHAVWNADSVGAYNIMRLYFQQEGIIRTLNQKGLSNTTIIKVAA